MKYECHEAGNLSCDNNTCEEGTCRDVTLYLRINETKTNELTHVGQHGASARGHPRVIVSLSGVPASANDLIRTKHLFDLLPDDAGWSCIAIAAVERGNVTKTAQADDAAGQEVERLFEVDDELAKKSG